MMINSEKKVRELGLRLKDKNTNAVVMAIEALRNEDPFSGAILLLAETYDNSSEVPVKDSIRNFMNDLKELSARSEVVAEIIKAHKPETLTMLVSSCWQSGLNYTEWASEFASLFCTTDYATALECFTVLEECSQDLDTDKKKEIVSILTDRKNVYPEDKKALLKALVLAIG